jgi:hypothetical protein
MAANALDGGPGDDRLTAAAEAQGDPEARASNLLEGGTGSDILLAEIVDLGSSDLLGGPGDDHLTVVGGNDNLLDGGPGRDRYQGGGGDDRFAIDAEDLLGSGTTLDGAEGEDTVLVDFDLDLTGLDDGRITNIERVDLADGAPNRLTLAFEDVLAVTDDASTLFVEGDGAAETGGAADAASLIGDWASAPTLAGFTAFTLANATVNVDGDVTTDVTPA